MSLSNTINGQAVRDQLARGRLKKLFPVAQAIGPALLDALDDDNWKVRRNALRVLDHAPVAGMESRIIELLQDEEVEVRKWAAHALGCDRCKEGSTLCVDPVPHLLDAVESDPSIVVRRSAVVCLAWNRPWDARISELMEALASGAADENIRFHASSAIRHRTATGA